MRTVKISDITLREYCTSRDNALSFKEKLEVIKCLDKLNVDTLELPAIVDEKADALFNKTAAFSANGRICASAGTTKESARLAWSSISEAKQPSLMVALPVSTVQMEYVTHKKAPKMLEMITELVGSCKEFTENVEFSAQDATRAEADFLCSAVNAAIEAGASRVTLCDTAGTMTPDEFYKFVSEVYAGAPTLRSIELFVEVSNEIGMASGCAAAAIDAGANGIKASVKGSGCNLYDTIHYIERKGADKGICCDIKTTELARGIKQLDMILAEKRSATTPFDAHTEHSVDISLDSSDNISDVINAARTLGYELSDDDNAKVYDAFKRVARRKHFVGTKELEAIIASTANQVPSTYHIVSYVINSGNIITATANITLEKDGEQMSNVAIGDGPIDASFLAIEQIIGHHYELDDFQINTVTEGRGAMGSALVKLRSEGKLYSGTGISTDILGASIRAYINALNKIVYEEN